jgi:hypothetical protein
VVPGGGFTFVFLGPDLSQPCCKLNAAGCGSNPEGSLSLFFWFLNLNLNLK